MSFGPYVEIPAASWTKDVLALTRHSDLAAATDLGDGNVLVELRRGLTVKDLPAEAQAAVFADRTHQDQRRHQRRCELGQLTVKEIQAYAADCEISLTGASLKATAIERIVDAQIPGLAVTIDDPVKPVDPKPVVEVVKLP